MTPAALGDLVRLAEARRMRDLARLEALIAASGALEAEIEALGRTHAADIADTAAEGAPAVPYAALVRRIAWADAEIAVRRRRIAALAIEIAGVRAAARVSLGKHEALRSLLARAERESRAADDRAEERGAAALLRGPADG